MKLATHNSAHQDSPAEEAASAITHLVALLLSAAGFGILVYQADLLNSWKALFAAIVYGTSLILLFLSSTLYHGLRHHGTKRFFLAFDHVAIFLLIAGTNTPVVLLGLPSPTSYVLFGVIWGLALFGILLRFFWFSGFQWASLPLYLLLGWISLAWAGPLSERLGAAGIWLIVAGGLCYTLGTLFYLLRRLRFNHAIWHFWVLAGAVCHFLAVQVYAMPSLT
jgi:hemolysin III